MLQCVPGSLASDMSALISAIDLNSPRYDEEVTASYRDLGGRVKRLQVRHHRAMESALAPLHVTTAQWDALRKLHQYPGASLHDLARLTYQTDQSFGALASRMIERGLIARVPGPGRAVRHQITQEGHQLRIAADDIVENLLAVAFEPLTAEEVVLLDALLVRLLPPPPALPLDDV